MSTTKLALPVMLPTGHVVHTRLRSMLGSNRSFSTASAEYFGGGLSKAKEWSLVFGTAPSSANSKGMNKFVIIYYK